MADIEAKRRADLVATGQEIQESWERQDRGKRKFDSVGMRLRKILADFLKLLLYVSTLFSWGWLVAQSGVVPLLPLPASVRQWGANVRGSLEQRFMPVVELVSPLSRAVVRRFILVVPSVEPEVVIRVPQMEVVAGLSELAMPMLRERYVWEDNRYLVQNLNARWPNERSLITPDCSRRYLQPMEFLADMWGKTFAAFIRVDRHSVLMLFPGSKEFRKSKPLTSRTAREYRIWLSNEIEGIYQIFNSSNFNATVDTSELALRTIERSQKDDQAALELHRQRRAIGAFNFWQGLSEDDLDDIRL